LLLQVDVGRPLQSHSDVTDHDAVIGSDRVAGSGRLRLAIDRRLEEIVAGRQGGAGQGGFFEKFPPGRPGGLDYF